MQRPRRVGRDIFDVDPLALPQIAPAKVCALPQNGTDNALPDRSTQPQVQEPRARHIRRGDPWILTQLFGQFLGDIARFHTGRFRQHHRGIGRHIPMRRIARRLYGDGVKAQPLGQKPVGNQRIKGGQHEAADIGK